MQQDHIAGYLAKARAKLRVARELAKQREWDDVVSRAYYAAFHAAQAVLLAEGHQAETHRGLLTLFSLVLVKTGKPVLSLSKDSRKNGESSWQTSRTTAKPGIMKPCHTSMNKQRAGRWPKPKNS